MNVLSLASSGLTGASSSSPLFSAAASSTLGGSAAAALTSALSPRDAAIAGLVDASPALNALQQAAGTLLGQSTSGQSTASSTNALVQLPPLPQAPAAQPAPTVPTDDHGQSNVVFSDADADGALIH
jgi:hypothetical protein